MANSAQNPGITREYVLAVEYESAYGTSTPLIAIIDGFFAAIYNLGQAGASLCGIAYRGFYGPKAYLNLQACGASLKALAYTVFNAVLLGFPKFFKARTDKTYFPNREAMSIIFQMMHELQNGKRVHELTELIGELKKRRAITGSLSRPFAEAKAMYENCDDKDSKHEMIKLIIQAIGGETAPTAKD